MVTLLLAAMLVACLATPDSTSFVGFSKARQLQQSFNCGQASQLQTPAACPAIWNCFALAQPKQNTASLKQTFTNSCNACAAATKSCSSKSAALPSACKLGLSIPAIANCITKLSGR